MKNLPEYKGLISNSVIQQYERLKLHDPKHELLKYATFFDRDQIFEEGVRINSKYASEFRRKFCEGMKGRINMHTVLFGYAWSMNVVSSEMEGIPVKKIKDDLVAKLNKVTRRLTGSRASDGPAELGALIGIHSVLC